MSDALSMQSIAEQVEEIASEMLEEVRAGVIDGYHLLSWSSSLSELLDRYPES